jgi:hypothetical protein
MMSLNSFIPNIRFETNLSSLIHFNPYELLSWNVAISSELLKLVNLFKYGDYIEQNRKFLEMSRRFQVAGLLYRVALSQYNYLTAEKNWKNALESQKNAYFVFEVDQHKSKLGLATSMQLLTSEFEYLQEFGQLYVDTAYFARVHTELAHQTGQDPVPLDVLSHATPEEMVVYLKNINQTRSSS